MERKDHIFALFLHCLPTLKTSISSQNLGLKIAAAFKRYPFQRQPIKTFRNILNSKH